MSYVTHKPMWLLRHGIKYSKYNYLLSIVGFFIITVFIMTEVKKEPMAPPSSTPVKSSSSSSIVTKPKAKTTKWGVSRQTVSTLKGAIPELSGKVFITGPSQATKYDETYKALLHYFNNKYDHRICRAIEAKDTTVGLALLTRPTPPKTKKTV